MTKIHEGLFKACDQVLLLDLENNSINTISFATLEPLKLCRVFNIQNNVFFNSKNLYTSFFEKYSRDEAKLRFHFRDTRYHFIESSDQSCFFIMRRSISSDKKLHEKSFLSFFLSTSSIGWSVIFSDANRRSLKSRFEDFENQSNWPIRFSFWRDRWYQNYSLERLHRPIDSTWPEINQRRFCH